MSKCTPQKRLGQFNNKELSIKKQKLFSNSCNQELDHLRKSTVEGHLLTPKHILNVNKNDSQKSLDFSEDEKKNAFKKDLILGFGSANIQLHKLHSKFFKNIFTKYLKVIHLI